MPPPPPPNIESLTVAPPPISKLLRGLYESILEEKVLLGKNPPLEVETFRHFGHHEFFFFFLSNCTCLQTSQRSQRLLGQFWIKSLATALWVKHLTFVKSEILEAVKAHANERNIVGQKRSTLLVLTCCVCLHGTATVLALVACSLRPVKLLGQCKRTQRCWPTTRNKVVTCCVRLHGPLCTQHNITRFQ